MVGAWLSDTLIVMLHDAVLPQMSVIVQVTVVEPTGND
jgi:hypothetical protein